MSDYNTKAVKETSSLPRFPLSKIKKIAKCDKDYIVTSNAAIVAAAFATELFVQSLTEDGLSMGHLQQGKKSKNKNNASKQARLTLDDLIESVQRKEQYYFLEDVINKKMFSKDSVVKSAVGNGKEVINQNDQSTLPFGKSNGKNTLEAIATDELDDNDDDDDDDDDAMDVDSDGHEHSESVVEGVEEEDEDEDEEEDEDLQEDEQNTELQKEMDGMHNVEDIDINDSDRDKDSDVDEEDKAKQRLIGRAETVEEVGSDQE